MFHVSKCEPIFRGRLSEVYIIRVTAALHSNFMQIETKNCLMDRKTQYFFSDWKRSLMSCVKFVETKPVANIMEWHHVTVAEDFSKEVFDV